jgi:hypothetical protein
LNLILGFSPFIAFSMLTRLSVSLALWIAFAAAFVISIRDFVETRGLKLLDTSSLILFGLMSVYTGLFPSSLSPSAVRLIVDLGLLIVISASMVLRRPFSLQYASERMPEEPVAAAVFMRTNYNVSAVWAAAFIAMTIADAFAAFDSSFPVTISVAAGLISLACAIVFTLRYPAYVKRHGS